MLMVVVVVVVVVEVVVVVVLILIRYVFCSIDTWLQGVCKSHCSDHDWKRACEWQPAGNSAAHI